MPHPLFERHAATLERALAAIAERGYWSPYSESPSPKVYGEGAAEAGKAAFDALATSRSRSTSRAPWAPSAARCRRSGSRWASPIPKADLGRAVRGGRGGRARLAEGGTGSLGRRVRRDPAPDQPAELPLRQRRDAHDRPGVHDGVPGGRPARAGPRARGRGVCVGRDEEDPGQGALGKAAGQERAAADGEAFPDRAARHRPGDRLLHVSDVERLSRIVRRSRHRQCRGRQAASGGDSAAGAHGQDRARGARRGGLRSQRRHAGRARGGRRRRAEAGARGPKSA